MKKILQREVDVPMVDYEDRFVWAPSMGNGWKLMGLRDLLARSGRLQSLESSESSSERWVLGSCAFAWIDSRS